MTLYEDLSVIDLSQFDYWPPMIMDKLLEYVEILIVDRLLIKLLIVLTNHQMI